MLGMSGGVDSSVAAHLLREEGYEVTGLSLILFETRGIADPRSCCSLEAVKDAAETAGKLGIKHTELDARDLFMEKVIGPFAESYSSGMTPNPCILCNRYVKFPLLLKEADAVGAGHISTGHYAKAEVGVLRRALDEGKDQSYVLYRLRGEELRRLVLPLGGLMKADVREIARKLGLPVFSRPESQEICFVAERSYREFVETVSPGALRPGPMVDEGGKRLGTHKGLYAYTLGQRKGLGIASLTPMYVTGIDPVRNEVRVGPRQKAERSAIKVREINWLLPKEGEFRADVKVRSMMAAAPAVISINGKGGAEVEFDTPQWAPAPGQSAVFYDGDVVLGGGVIVSSDAR